MFRRNVSGWFARVIATSLVLAQVPLGVPILAQTRRPGSGPLPAPKVNVNRKVPVVALPPVEPTFSASPTPAEIFRARVFPEPIVPVGGDPGADETKALAQALAAFHRGGGLQWRATIGSFLDSNPRTVWRASLLLNLGTIELQGHAYAGALEAWDEAWTLSKDLTDSRGRAIADAAVAEWLMLEASLGQVKQVEDRLATLVDRSFSGSAGVKIQRAREDAALTKRHPELAKYCGPEALLAFFEASEGPKAAPPKALTSYRGALDGLTLTELSNLGVRAGLALRMVRRVDALQIPVPSIVHWRFGHYGTVVERRTDQYRILDRARGESYWLDAATLLRETSGFFLVSMNALELGWETVSADEGQSIRGSGPECPDGSAPPAQAENPEETEEAEDSENQTNECPGMCGYEFQAVSASLVLRDTPVRYFPPKGPRVNFTVGYHQRDILQPQIFSFANLGPKWSLNWVRFVKEQPTDALGVTPAHVWVSLPPGGREVFINPDGQGVYPAHPDSRAVLVRVSSNPIRYERRLRGGTVEVFAFSDGAAPGSRRIFLTELIDPQGLHLQFTWDAQFRLVAVTDALGQVSTIQYDLPAHPLWITSITDPFGRTAQFSYNVAGQLESIIDVIGLESRFSYGGDDFVSALMTPYGTTTFRHEPSALNSGYSMRFIEATDPLGGTERTEFQWETPSLDATESSSAVPTGFAASNNNLNRYNTFYWDKRAFAAGAGDLSKAVVTHWLLQPEWEGWQLYSSIPHSVKRPLENRIWFAYSGQLSGYEYIGGWWNEPSVVARVLDDGSSQIWQSTYSSKGLPLTRTDPLGRQTAFTYDTNGIDLLSVRQTTGGINDLVMALGGYSGHRPQSVTDASGASSALAYNGAGQLVTITNALSETLTYGYDTNGYLSSSSGAVSGSTTTFSQDAYGRPRTVTGPDGYSVTIDYDAFDRPIRFSYPDSTYEEFTYNRLDPVQYRDRAGRITRYFYDANGNRVGTRDPAGQVVTLVWCSCGSLDALVDAGGHRTVWQRDLQGRVTSETRANGSHVDFLYETSTSRLKRRTDPKGQQANYSYALDDALVGMSYANATTSTASVTLTYDATYGRPIAMADATGTTTYTYKSPGNAGAGQVATIDGPLADDTISYSYDALGRVAGRTLHGVTTSWTHDGLGRVTALDDPIGTFSYAYVGGTARVSQLTYPNNQVSTFTYLNNAGDRRLQEIHHKTSSGTTLSKFTYAYNAGNLTTWTQQYQTTARAYDFSYDAAGQLTGAVYRTTDTTPSVLTRYAYRYDAAGNRTGSQVDDVPTAWTYDVMNRVTARTTGGPLTFEGTVNEAATVMVQGKPAIVDSSNRFVGSATVSSGTNSVAVTATDASGNTRVNTYQVDLGSGNGTLSYDGNGNLTSQGTKTYEWDAENRLVRVLDNSTEIATFTYDGFGRRATKTVGGAQRTYVYDDEDIAEERTSSVTIRHIHGPRTDEPLATVDGSAVTYYLADHLGSIVQTTDTSSAVTLTRQYDPYGQLLTGGSTGGYAFTGREWDPEIGLYYYRARYYDPGLGRFISQDPIEFAAGSPNFYAYVRNRSNSLRDPSGKQVGATTIEGASWGAEVGSGFGPAGTIVGGIIGGLIGLGTGIWVNNNVIKPMLTDSTKPPNDAYNPTGPKAPGKPTAADGFKDPKTGERWVQNPNGVGKGWEDAAGDVWVPTGVGPKAHGGPHWDVQTPGRGYRNVYPKCK